MTDSAQNALAAKRVGQYLIDAGVLKREQLDEALDRQKRMSKAGFHVLLGTILEEMDAIDRQSLEAIILRQRLDEGSVNLGTAADWSPFRSPVEPEHAGGNGKSEHAPHSGDDSPETESQAGEIAPAGEALAEAEQADEQITVQKTPVEEPPMPVATFKPMDDSAFVPAASSSEELQMSESAEATFIPADGPNDLAPSGWEPQAASMTDDDIPTHATEAAPPSVEEDLPPFPLEGVDMVSEVTDVMTEGGDSETLISFDQPAEAEPEFEAHTDTISEVNSWSSASDSSPPSDELSAEDPVDVLGFRFSRRPQGLAETEVSAVIGQLVRRARALEDQINEAKDTLSHLDSMRRYAEQSIKAADTIAEQIHKEAEQQAGVIRERAQHEARKIVSDAKSQSDEIVSDARTQSDDILRTAAQKAQQAAADFVDDINAQLELNRRMLDRAEHLIQGETAGEDQE